MPQHKMITIDGIRYRPEDAPERPAEDAGKANPVSTQTAKPVRSRRKKEDGDADSGGAAG